MAGKSPEVNAANTGKVKVGEEAKISDMERDFGPTSTSKIAQITTTNNGTEWILDSRIPNKPGELFLYIDDSGNYREIFGADAIRDVYVRNATATGKLEILRERLYKAGYMNEQQFKTKDATALNGAIVRSARNASV